MIKADDVTKRNRELNKKWFTTPSKWARHPILPLKRYREQNAPPELGYILAHDLTTVRLGNMFNTDISNQKTISYASIDAVVDDFWQVD